MAATGTLKRTFCVILLCLSLNTIAQAQNSMTDPLFGISYDRRKVHFERMPPRLSEKCPRLKGRYVAAWVYGHLKTADSEYFLISGLMESQEDNPGGARTIAPDEGDGVAVALRGSMCLVDQGDYFLTQNINRAKNATPIVAPEEDVTGVLKDAFKRYVAAFGGKQKLVELVKPDVIGPPNVRKEFEIFAREAGE